MIIVHGLAWIGIAVLAPPFGHHSCGATAHDHLDPATRRPQMLDVSGCTVLEESRGGMAVSEVASSAPSARLALGGTGALDRRAGTASRKMRVALLCTSAVARRTH